MLSVQLVCYQGGLQLRTLSVLLSEEFQLFILTYCYPYLYSRQGLNNTSAEHWESSDTGLYGGFVLIYSYAKTKGKAPENISF